MATTQERIEAILPRLNFIARKLCWGSLEHEPEDLVSEEVLAILELAGKNGGNLDKFNDAYLCQCAYFKLKHKVKATWDYGKHVQEEVFFETDEGDQISSFERLAPESIPVEEEVSDRLDLNHLVAACRQMPPTYQMIISLLLSGYRVTDIAGELGVTKSRVSQRIGEIRRRVYSLQGA